MSVTIDGAVTGSQSGANAAGVWIDSAAANTLTVGESGVVRGDEALAIRATSGSLAVSNRGQVFGSTVLRGGAMDNAGLYVPGSVFEGDLINQGTVKLGGAEHELSGRQRTRYTTTTLNGNLTQTPAGMLQLGADFHTMESDVIHVSGDVKLDGQTTVLPRGLLPGRELAIVTSDRGTPTGSLAPLHSPLFNYVVRNTDNAVRLSVPNANFNAPKMGLRGNQEHVAEHLQRGWDAGGSPALARLYVALDLSSRAGASQYQQRMSDLSPGVTVAPGVQAQLGTSRFTRAMMSCPTWTDVTAISKERDCFWGDVSHRRTSQEGYSTVSGYSYETETYQFGGQRQVAPQWFLGGSVAYQTARIRGDDGRASGSGDAGYVGVVLKREQGPWAFSGALSGGYGSFDMDRSLDVAPYATSARARPDVYTFGARLRAARTFASRSLYLKPYVDLTAQYARVPGYNESGDALSLEVDSSDQFVVGLEPALEIGGLVALPKGIILRPFAYAGLAFLAADNWTTSARLKGSPSGSGGFDTTMPADHVIRRAGVGLQLLDRGGLSMRLQYDGEFSSTGDSHAGSLKVAAPF